MTALFSDLKSVQKQDPLTDYHLLTTDNPTNLAWTAHLPINEEEGSYIYIWRGQGCGTAVHIVGGQCLLLRSDVIHSGGVPEGCGVGKPHLLGYIFTFQQNFKSHLHWVNQFTEQAAMVCITSSKPVCLGISDNDGTA